MNENKLLIADVFLKQMFIIMLPVKLLKIQTSEKLL